jgi:hypothetical protein
MHLQILVGKIRRRRGAHKRVDMAKLMAKWRLRKS